MLRTLQEVFTRAEVLKRQCTLFHYIWSRVLKASSALPREARTHMHLPVEGTIILDELSRLIVEIHYTSAEVTVKRTPIASSNRQNNSEQRQLLTTAPSIQRNIRESVSRLIRKQEVRMVYLFLSRRHAPKQLQSVIWLTRLPL